MAIRFPIWFECDKCGKEEEGDYTVLDWFNRPSVPSGWMVERTEIKKKLLCPRCRQKSGF